MMTPREDDLTPGRPLEDLDRDVLESRGEEENEPLTPLSEGELEYHRQRNRLQVLRLIGGAAMLFAIYGWILMGAVGLLILGLVGALLVGLGPRFIGRLLLRLYRARPIFFHEMPEIFGLLRKICIKARLERVPAIYRAPTETALVFSVADARGPIIIIADRLLRVIDRRELAATFAHEVAHLRCKDVTALMMADTLERICRALWLLGVVLLLANILLLALGGGQISWLFVLALLAAPLAAVAIQGGDFPFLREANVDRECAALTGDPVGLALALDRLEDYKTLWWEEVALPGRRSPEPSLARVHPSHRERIDRMLTFEADAPPDAIRRPIPLNLPDNLLGQEQPTRWHWSGLWY